MAVRFDAAADRLLRTAEIPSLNQTWTLMFWVYLTSDLNNFSTFVNIGSSVFATQQYQFVGTDSNGTTIINDRGGSSSTGINMSTARWYHIAILYGAAANRTDVYVDGILGPQSTQSSMGDPVGARFEFGAVSTANTDRMNGRIAFIKWWNNRILSQAEIQTEMFSIKPKFTESLAGFWPTLAGLGERSRDYSGFGRDFTEGGTLTDEQDPPVTWGDSVIVFNDFIDGVGPILQQLTINTIALGINTLSKNINARKGNVVGLDTQFGEIIDARKTNIINTSTLETKRGRITTNDVVNTETRFNILARLQAFVFVYAVQSYSQFVQAFLSIISYVFTASQKVVRSTIFNVVRVHATNTQRGILEFIDGILVGSSLSKNVDITRNDTVSVLNTIQSRVTRTINNIVYVYTQFTTGATITIYEIINNVVNVRSSLSFVVRKYLSDTAAGVNSRAVNASTTMNNIIQNVTTLQQRAFITINDIVSVVTAFATSTDITIREIVNEIAYVANSMQVRVSTTMNNVLNTETNTTKSISAQLLNAVAVLTTNAKNIRKTLSSVVYGLNTRSHAIQHTIEDAIGVVTAHGKNAFITMQERVKVFAGILNRLNIFDTVYVVTVATNNFIQSVIESMAKHRNTISMGVTQRIRSLSNRVIRGWSKRSNDE